MKATGIVRKVDELITIGSNSFCYECIELFARELAMRLG